MGKHTERKGWKKEWRKKWNLKENCPRISRLRIHAIAVETIVNLQLHCVVNTRILYWSKIQINIDLGLTILSTPIDWRYDELFVLLELRPSPHARRMPCCFLTRAQVYGRTPFCFQATRRISFPLKTNLVERKCKRQRQLLWKLNPKAR